MLQITTNSKDHLIQYDMITKVKNTLQYQQSTVTNRLVSQIMHEQSSPPVTTKPNGLQTDIHRMAAS